MKADRVFAALLRVYPARARDAFGRGMTSAWRADLDAARRRGGAAPLAFWITTVAEAARFGMAEQFANVSPRRALATDWRDAWRSLRTAPLVTTFCVVSLAMGIGGATALFSILNSLALKPLPVRDPQRLVLLDDGPWTNPIWEAIRDRESAIGESAAAWATGGFNLAPSGEADRVRGLFVSGGFFDVLGVRPAAGRLIDVRDDTRHGGTPAPVAVISHAFWRSRFSSAPDAIGQTILIERVPFTIVGITPAGFFGPDVGRSYDVAVALAAEPLVRTGSTALDDRLSWWMNIFVRLRPDESAAAATARLRAVQPQIRTATLPDVGGDEDRKQYLSEALALLPAPGGRSPLRAQYEQPLTAILAVVGLVLVIACANIASLLIARASARRREMAVRLAIGASRFRVARQLLAESALIAIAGAVGGLAVARWGSRLLLDQFTIFGGRVDLDLAPDWRVFGFASGVTAVAAILSGLAPALGVRGLGAGDALKDRPGGSSAAPARARHASVVVQVALSLALLVAAGLIVRTFTRLSTRDVGFDRDRVLLVSADITRSGAKGPARLQIFDRLVAAAAAVPGVSSAAGSFITPLGSGAWNTLIDMPGSQLPRRQRTSWMNAITPNWLRTMGLRLREGRDFTPADRAGAPQVAIVNRAFVRRFLGGGAAIGRSFSTDEPEGKQRFEVVGVVDDALYRSLRGTMDPTMFVPLAQAGSMGWTLSVATRAAGPIGTITRGVPDALQRAEPEVVLSVRTLRDQLDAAMTQERLLATLGVFFGGLSLLLAAVGLYGIAAFAVASRRAEIGIRIALGASAGGIVRLVLRRIAMLVAIGLVLGGALTAWAAPLARTLLYDVEPHDPMTQIGAALALLAVALVAAWLPARRASRIDPMNALRSCPQPCLSATAGSTRAARRAGR
jgi:predicted permease